MENQLQLTALPYNKPRSSYLLVILSINITKQSNNLLSIQPYISKIYTTNNKSFLALVFSLDFSRNLGPRHLLRSIHAALQGQIVIHFQDGFGIRQSVILFLEYLT